VGQSADQDTVGVILGKGQGFGVGGGAAFELAATVFQAPPSQFFVRVFKLFLICLPAALKMQ